MSGATEADRRFMAAALRLGRSGLGRTWPNPSVACLIVRDDGGGPIVVGRGVTADGGRPHAEAIAIAAAGALARGATAYVTLEPCSHVGKTGPCAEALVQAGVARVVCALGDPDPRVAGRGFAMLRAAGITVTEDVLADVALRDHAGHVARVRLGRPHITLKMAVSADGKAGLPAQRVLITGDDANRRVHMLRAMSDAILVGIGTVLADDPALTVRLPGLESRSPVRVVFDARLRLPPSSVLARTAREVPTHVVCDWAAPTAAADALTEQGVVVHRVTPPWPGGPGVNLPVALRTLVKLGITRVLLEGGPTLAAACLERDAVDEIVVFRGPQTIGPAGLPVLDPGPLDAPLQDGRFALADTQLAGRDVMTTYVRRR